jgi:cell filamentation protein
VPPSDRSWAEYFYPETYNAVTMSGTLRNKLGERDPAVLAAKEYSRTTARQRQLMSGEVHLPRTLDADHVRAIHRHLFQDVYDWAGEYRMVPIYNGTPVGFADVAGAAIDRYLIDVHRLISATPWTELDRDGFGESAATVFAYLNQARPSGRATGVRPRCSWSTFPSFTLEYDRVDPDVWNEASKWSGPDLFAYEPHPAQLVPILRLMVVDRRVERALGQA